MITSTSTYAVTNDVLFRELEGEMVLLDTSSATYFSLNETGTHVWRLVRSRATVEEVCQELATKYGLSQEEVMADLIPFLEELLEVGLIQPDS